MYYVGTIPAYSSDELAHFGVLGMKWGVRRYQNLDGTLTPQGLSRRRKLQQNVEKTGKRAQKLRSKAEVAESIARNAAMKEYKRKRSILFRPSQEELDYRAEKSVLANNKSNKARERAFQADRRYANAQKALSRFENKMQRDRDRSVDDKIKIEKAQKIAFGIAAGAAAIGVGALVYGSRASAVKSGKNVVNAIIKENVLTENVIKENVLKETIIRETFDNLGLSKTNVRTH